LADASNHPTPSDAADTAAGGSSGPRGELGPGDTTRAGTGFDTALGRLLVERGVLQQSSLDDCLRELQVRAGDSRPTSLQELLAERNLVSGEQIDKVRGEVEASAEASKGSTKIPGYQMLRKLGQGAMAKVFLARQKSLDRLVAIKVLPPKLTTSNFVARFQKEGRAAASLSHNNIVAAYEIGEANGYHYFVMEYVDGDTVYDRIVARKRLPEREALDIIRQIASALEHAHERGFVHRDIKPRNIMMTRSGVAKLADLGLARSISDKELAESEAGRAYGTPFYISPEQIQGKVDIGPPADIYGLGATFYHMVTGRVPYEAKTQSEVMQKHLRAPLVPPDHLNPQLSAGTALIIETMLAKDLRDRYRNARDLINDIDLVLAGKDPEFAKPAVDIGAIATAVQVTAQDPVEIVRKNSESPFASPLVLSLVAVLALSLIGNVVLVLVLLSR
jgi:serine/threonine-protein kinase